MSESLHLASRRRFLAGVGALAAGLTAAPQVWAQTQAQTGPSSLPADPATSGIQHIVVVTMENRSFDHFLGWLPGARGRQAGLHYLDARGVAHATHPLAPDYQGCGHPDPDHSYTGGRVEYDGGRCDGWLRAGSNDEYAIGYYTRQDLAFLGQAAPQWSVCDEYFAAIMAETYPNRFYTHAAQTDRLTNTTTLSALPTIWDRLAAAGLDGRYYFSDVPFLALWGTKYLPISRLFGNFLVDCVTGNLPNVAYVDPRFLDENSGTSGDDHPHADIRNGEAFLNLVYTAVTRSPAWPSTVLVVTYDEWGGFFDHIAPQAAPIPPASRAAGDTDGLRGFRVPCLVVAPWAPRGSVAHTLYDHTSILKAIEWRWNLQPLTVRDQTANNLFGLLDFERPRLQAPLYAVPPGPFGAACQTTGATAPTSGATAQPTGAAEPKSEWVDLQSLARSSGWPVSP